MMLSKRVCKSCAERNRKWSSNDEEYWKKGLVRCRFKEPGIQRTNDTCFGAYHWDSVDCVDCSKKRKNACIRYKDGMRFIKRAPPKSCEYKLEHLVDGNDHLSQ